MAEHWEHWFYATSIICFIKASNMRHVRSNLRVLAPNAQVNDGKLQLGSAEKVERLQKRQVRGNEAGETCWMCQGSVRRLILASV